MKSILGLFSKIAKGNQGEALVLCGFFAVIAGFFA